MAEVVGLVASIATISKCISIAGNLAVAFKDRSERFESLKMTLTGIQLTSKMIKLHVGKMQANTDLEEGSPAQPIVPHQSGGYIKDLLGECLRNLESLVVRLEIKIIPGEAAQRQKQGLMQMVCKLFRKKTDELRLSLEMSQLDVLISAAKRVEASLGVALTGLLCCQYKDQSTQKDKFAEEMQMQLDYHTKAFQELKKSLDNFQKPMMTWEEVSPTNRQHLQSTPRQDRSHDLGPENRSEGMSETLPITSTFAKEDCMSSQKPLLPLQLQDAGTEDDQIKVAIGSSTFSTPLNCEESPEGPGNIEALLLTLNKDLEERTLHLTTPVPDSSSAILASERPVPLSDVESQTPSVSNAESEIWDSDFADQRSEIVPYDSDEIVVKSKSRIFMDVDIDLSICFRSDTGVWKFCTRSLLLLDNDEATFILQNPCKTYCDHISIQTESATSLGERVLPQTLEVSLCNISTATTSTTSTATIQDHQSLSFTVVSSSHLNYLRTWLVHKQKVMKWVAGGSELSIVVQTPHSGPEEDDDEARTVADEENNSEQEEEDSGDLNLPDEHRRLGPFSSVPCFFCRQDALNPRWSGGGYAGFLFGSNKSLRMTCERCNDSTWISAMMWGPSFPGGTWHVGN
ncbi:hypothetical protein CC80DRAFT_487210 [Byssothecium circinans]|uniref:Fungal N-terminal domain-containing protein n=1 Tax=Byssothecium circinans TaxID=147558 RepID=A0A6A5UFJ8_9PLEO|nr:hypothetical protein CC80DRAFT_487210 [Byssothecium circinans]